MKKILFGLAIFMVGMVAFGGQVYAAVPSVETFSADVISSTAATLNGELNPEDRPTTFWFEYGTSRNDLDEDTSHQSAGSFDGFIDVYHTINGLDRDTTYYFRLVARNSSGTEEGDVLSFRTSGRSGRGAPVVSTGFAQMSGNSAILEGDVNPQGFTTRAWFRYGRSSGSLNNTTNTVTLSGGSSQSFSRTISNLDFDDVYYYQAVAENQYGTNYGDILNFDTSDFNGGGPVTGNAPLVATNSASVLGSSSALLRAQVNPNGYLGSVWFEYGRTPSLGAVTTRDPAGSGGSMTNYSVTLSGLSAGTTYYYRAVAQNPYGANRGQVLNFRTSGTAVTPSTGGPGVVSPNPPAAPVPTPTSTPSAAPGCFSVSPALNSPQFNANSEVIYSVTYNNACSFALANASLQITLPLAMDFAGTNFPFLSRDANVITYNLGSIAQNFQATVTVTGKVKAQVNSGDMLIFESKVTFTDPNGSLQNASGFLTATITAGAEPAGASTSTLGASVADNLSGLFHSGWFWLVLFLILIALFVFWLATRRRGESGEGDEDDDDEEVAHAA